MAVYGWRASFYICAATSFLWVILWALTFTEYPAEHPRITQAELSLSLLSLLPLLLSHDLYLCLACLCAGFFFAEMTIGPMWAIPMDIAPKYSGTASAMMNTGSSLAAIISAVISGMESTGEGH